MRGAEQPATAARGVATARGLEGETPSTTIAIVTLVDGTTIGIAREGVVFEGVDIYSLGVAVGDTVLADYLSSSGQWIIVAIVP